MVCFTFIFKIVFTNELGLLAIGYEKYGSNEELEKDPIRHLYEVYVKINVFFHFKFLKFSFYYLNRQMQQKTQPFMIKHVSISKEWKMENLLRWIYGKDLEIYPLLNTRKSIRD